MFVRTLPLALVLIALIHSAPSFATTESEEIVEPALEQVLKEDKDDLESLFRAAEAAYEKSDKRDLSALESTDRHWGSVEFR